MEADREGDSNGEIKTTPGNNADDAGAESEKQDISHPWPLLK